MRITLFLPEGSGLLELSAPGRRDHLVQHLPNAFPPLPLLPLIVDLFSAVLEFFEDCTDAGEPVLPGEHEVVVGMRHPLEDWLRKQPILFLKCVQLVQLWLFWPFVDHL